MSRDVSLLHPELQQKINAAILKTIAESGNGNIPKWGISETFRTVEEQNALYAKGRTVPGSIVTNATGTSYNSMHQWGVAFDIYRNDGKGLYYDADGGFTRICKLIKSVGLEWGGDWSGFVDRPHFQLPQWGSTPARLKAQYGTPDNFKKTWGKAELVSKDVKEVSTANNSPSLEEDKLRKLALYMASLPRYRVRAKSGLRIRAKANMSSDTIVVMPFNSEFIGTGKTSGKWVYGEWNGNKGWAHGDYLMRV